MLNRNYKVCHIAKLEKDNGDTIIEANDILEDNRQFYKTLYKEDSSLVEEFHDYFLNNNIPKLDNKMVEQCEQEITADECTTKSLKDEKW